MTRGWRVGVFCGERWWRWRSWRRYWGYKVPGRGWCIGPILFYKKEWS